MSSLGFISSGSESAIATRDAIALIDSVAGTVQEDTVAYGAAIDVVEEEEDPDSWGE